MVHQFLKSSSKMMGLCPECASAFSASSNKDIEITVYSDDAEWTEDVVKSNTDIEIFDDNSNADDSEQQTEQITPNSEKENDSEKDSNLSTERIVISSYPTYTEASYSVSKTGTCGFAIGVYDAMEEYKDNADYRVVFDIFRNETGQVFDYDELSAEADRLSELGYNVTVETEEFESGKYSYLSLTVKYDQLKNFAVNEN